MNTTARSPVRGRQIGRPGSLHRNWTVDEFSRAVCLPPMSERPNWFARKRRKVRRAIFRRFVLPQLNRELQDAGVTFYRYDEQVDRLHDTNPVRWESLTRAAGESLGSHVTKLLS